MSDIKFNFINKVSVVTGAGRGIGQEIALALAASGSTTYAFSKTLSSLELLKQKNDSIQITCVDVTSSEEVKKAIDKIDRIDFLVNNAGIASLQHSLDVDEESFDKVMAVNVKAAINISKLVAQKAVKNKLACSIVNISSQGSTRALDNHLSYCVSKAALDHVTRVMAKELGPHNIRVNAVNPTVVLTDMGREVWSSEKPETKAMLSRIPIGRFASQSEVAAPVLFLLSDAASMITGATLPVDGGFTIS